MRHGQKMIHLNLFYFFLRMKVIFPSCPVLPLKSIALFVTGKKKTEQLSNFS